MSRRSIVALVGLTVGAGVFLLYRYDPALTAIFPPCPFHALTGLHCPGCGSLRAFHALLHGDVGGAVGFNPLVTLASPVLFVATAREAYRLACGVDPLGLRLPAWSIRALAVVIVAFGVLRNLRPFSWLAPN